jgi:hypothetical protein
MILNTGDNYEVDASDIIAWQRTYPAVNVHQEILVMESWCDANPTKRKTKSGIKRFINLWLSKAQNQGGSPMAKRRTDGTSLRSMTLPMQLSDVSWVSLEDRPSTIQLFLEKYGHYYLDGELHHGS